MSAICEDCYYKWKMRTPHNYDNLPACCPRCRGENVAPDVSLTELQKNLDSNNVIIRTLGDLDKINSISDPKTIGILVFVAINGEMELKTKALTLLADKNDERVIEPLVQGLKEMDTEFLEIVELGLIRQGDKSISSLISLLTDLNPHVRREALWCLGMIHNPIAITHIQPLTKDPVKYVRKEALESINKLNQK